MPQNDFDLTLDDYMKMVMQRFDKLDHKLERLFTVKNIMEDDELLDNQDLCHLLGVTKRTLQRYRQKKLLKYHMIDNGKAYYLKSELPEFLLKRSKK